ncbi:MAG: NADP-dependent malic enzyme [Eubacteriaceae bacterium]|nr:NADP-dependent malic enzyme [Eubacteriaceae bacterium]
MDYFAESLKHHERYGGKLSIESKIPLETKDDLSIAYTPGVAEPSRAIADDINAAYKYTIKKNSVAVISDGSAVLGLGNIGPTAAIPVMEGKCALFKKFAGIDAFPICVASQDPEDIIRTAIMIEPVFGGINLEDIAAPKCFEVENALINELNIPVFHDDQHGTAIVVAAALLNALKLSCKAIASTKIAISGAGAAGNSIAKMLLALGFIDIIVCDSKGILDINSPDSAKAELATLTNPEAIKGGMPEAIAGADVFIGVSAPSILTQGMVRQMAKDPIVFALANPTPEIMPDEAFAAGAKIVGTGRSDFANQINNVLAFPGVFRGALDSKAAKITEEMKLAAINALASLAGESIDMLLPSPFDERIVPAISKAVAGAKQ